MTIEHLIKVMSNKKVKNLEAKNEIKKLNEEAASILINELQKVQKEENESLEKKDVIKKEIIECEAILKKYDDKRIQLKEHLKYLEKKSHDFVKRRNEIIGKFKESHKVENNNVENKEIIKTDVQFKNKDGSEQKVYFESASFTQTESTFSKIHKDRNSCRMFKREPKYNVMIEVNDEIKNVNNKRHSEFQVIEQKKVKNDNLYSEDSSQQSSNCIPNVEKNSSQLKKIRNLVAWDSFSNTSFTQTMNNSITNDEREETCKVLHQKVSSAPSVNSELRNSNSCETMYGSHLTGNNCPKTNSNINSPVISQFEPIYKLDKLIVAESNYPNTRSICFLRAIDKYIYVSCKDGTVKRYNIENYLDFIQYRGNIFDAVITILPDYKRNLLFTGSKNGVFRCFKMDTGYSMGSKTLFSQIQTICEGWDRIVVALSDGKVIQLEFKPEQLSETNEKFKLKDRILSICLLANKKIFALLVNSRPQIIDATNGSVLKVFSTDLTYFPAYIEFDHFFCFTATSCGSLPLDNKKSTIVVYDQVLNWQVVIRKQERGVVTAMQEYMRRLYVAILLHGFTRFHCYSIPDLGPIWIAYSNRERVFGLTVYGNNVIVGSETGEITCFAPEEEGPYFCRNCKCNCLMPFARKSDLETHQNRYIQ